MPGGVGRPDGSTVIDTTVRLVETRKLQPNELSCMSPIYEKLTVAMRTTNAEYYRFDLDSRIDISVLRYRHLPQLGAAHYRWHRDSPLLESNIRKLSMSVQLSSPDTYSGCDLALFTDGELNLDTATAQGDAVLFPSWTPHCVTPLRRGIRYSLLAWAYGPAFR